jgi:hypothetical protein
MRFAMLFAMLIECLGSSEGGGSTTKSASAHHLTIKHDLRYHIIIELEVTLIVATFYEQCT